MTPELADRILTRKTKGRGVPISEGLALELLMDWLEGASYQALASKYPVSRKAATKIVNDAKKQAQAMMEGRVA